MGNILETDYLACFMFLRYLQWLVQENGPDAALYHTELALSLAKAALDSLPPSLEGLDHDEKDLEPKFSPINDHSLTRRPSMNHDVVRGMLQTFLAASDEYEADEVLALIQGSELWREQVSSYFNWMSTRLSVLVLATKYH